MRFLAHAGLHLNPHPSESVLLWAIGFAVLALAAVLLIRYITPSDSQTPVTTKPCAHCGHTVPAHVMCCAPCRERHA